MVVTLRAYYRAQKPQNPKNTNKIRNPPPRLAPENMKKIPKKYENDPKTAIFVLFWYFFHIFGANSGWGISCFFGIFGVLGFLGL